MFCVRAHVVPCADGGIMKSIVVSGKRIVILTALMAQACSSLGSGDDGPATGQVSQSDEADWIHPACDASALGPLPSDVQACRAPMGYSYREFVNCGTTC